MSFIDGWLGLCGAVGAGAATEVTGPAYARQRIAFNLVAPYWAGEGTARAITPRAVSSVPFTFPNGLVSSSGLLAGYGVYDAPTGGNLLLAIPYGSGGRVGPSNGPSVSGGLITLEGPMFDPSFGGQVQAGAAMGGCYDQADVVGKRTPAAGEVQGPEGFVTLIRRGALTAGVALVINRGILQSASSFAAL